MELKQLFTTIDTHVAGEPLRMITGGVPHIKGHTILEKRAYFREHFDHIRRVLMYEPRGHHGMYGCIFTPPVSEDADFGILFMHNEGLSTMCGHGIICSVTAAIETGLCDVPDEGRPIVIDSPAGKVAAYAQCRGTQVESVSFENVPSFVLAQDVHVHVQGMSFKVDIAYGGAFYAIVNASDIGLRTEISQLSQLKKWGSLIKHYIEGEMKVVHPLEKELHGIYGVIFSDNPHKESSDLRNVTIFADEQVDRSPCGTGTSARMAALFQRQSLAVGDTFVHEGIVGGQFVGKILGTTTVDRYPAIVPRISGRAFITGIHQFVVDPTDPLAEGFLLQ